MDRKILIFDYGGVFSSGSRTKLIIERLSQEYDTLPEEISLFFNEAIVVDIALGKRPISELYQKLLEILPGSSDQYLDEIFKESNEPSPAMLSLLDELSKRSTLILISDSLPPFTNFIMQKFQDTFSEMFFSDLCSARKSDESLFRAAEENLPSLFKGNIYIDDNLDNLKYPISKGSIGIHFKSASFLRSDLKSLGIL